MKGENRRVAMTRRMIKDALIFLMEEKDFAKISISDICTKADINRSTFYSHYKDTRQVISDIEDDIISRFPVIEGYDKDFRLAIRSIFAFIKDNSELITIMVVKRRDDSFMEKIIKTALTHL